MANENNNDNSVQLNGPLNGQLINNILPNNNGQQQNQQNDGFAINNIAKVPFPTMPGVHQIDLWFAQMRSWFELNRITSDSTKYNMVIAHLRHDALEQVEELVRQPPEQNKFESIKNALVQRFADSERTRIHKLLSGITLGDKKPSHLLQELRRANVGNDETILKNVWMARMPAQAQAVISIAHGGLSEVAALADVVVETLRINNNSMNVNEVRNVASSSSEQDRKIDELTRIVAELRADRNRGRSQSRGRAHNREKTPAREFDLCWYHFKFGANAKKCGKDSNPPKNCKYSSKNE